MISKILFKSKILKSRNVRNKENPRLFVQWFTNMFIREIVVCGSDFGPTMCGLEAKWSRP